MSVISKLFDRTRKHPEARNIMISIGLSRKERKLACDDLIEAAKLLQNAKDHLDKAVDFLNERDIKQQDGY